LTRTGEKPQFANSRHASSAWRLFAWNVKEGRRKSRQKLPQNKHYHGKSAFALSRWMIAGSRL
jgi:hypothetical protein